jgi:leucyl aminopeptidase
MFNFSTTKTEKIIPIIPVVTTDFNNWLKKQNQQTKNWLAANKFTAKSATFCIMPNKNGSAEKIFLGVENADDFWAFGVLPNKLPEGIYQIVANWKNDQLNRAYFGWALGCYNFSEYKKIESPTAKLFISEQNFAEVANIVDGIFLVRNLINFPAADLNPESFAEIITDIANEFNANITTITGKDLLKKGFGGIYAVGSSSPHQPCLVEFTWGNRKHKKVTLVGKGVCFDSGGLDIKPSDNMLLMKKDMAGAAHALALAQMIMSAELPIYLHVIIPLAENVVGSKSFKPGDVIRSYKGLTVEVTNTDAEGRLLLMDALALACENKPDLLIDFASLTGAARIALGTDIAALFSNNDELAEQIKIYAEQEQDPVCQLPLYAPYKDQLKSDIADLANSGSGRYGGAITAALFLQEFVDSAIPWLHFDIMAYNLSDKPGRPKGGDAQGLRAIFQFITNSQFNC